MNEKKYLIVVGGPTCVGKTSMSIQIARKLRCEILSADSRQIFSELNIGTAKPSASELAQVPHHFINHVSIHEKYTAGKFENEAEEFMKTYYQSNSILVMTGGSGLYIKAVCEGLDIFPEVAPEVSAKLSSQYEKLGITYLQKLLKEKDPEYYAFTDIQNPRRLLRALGIILSSGSTYSSFRKGVKPKKSFTPVYILLQEERKIIYDRINHRVDIMIESGLIEEARSLYPYRHMRSLQTVGYQELFKYFENECTLEQAINLIKQNTRRYAKRQNTWFRKSSEWQSFYRSDFESILTSIQKICI